MSDYTPSKAEFQRAWNEGYAKGLREGAGIVTSQAQEEWRKDRDGVVGAQSLAIELQFIASIICGRAKKIEADS